MESKDKPCRYYLGASYCTCESCNLDGKYTSCYGDHEKCKFKPNPKRVGLKPDDRFEVTEKGKEYLRSH